MNQNTAITHQKPSPNGSAAAIATSLMIIGLSRLISLQFVHEGKRHRAREFNLYSTKDEKLVWSGESDTLYSKDFEKLGKGYAESLVKQLKKDKVIRKN